MDATETLKTILAEAINYTHLQNDRAELEQQEADSLAFEMNGEISSQVGRAIIAEMKAEMALNAAILAAPESEIAQVKTALERGKFGQNLIKNVENAIDLRDQESLKVWIRIHNETLAEVSNEFQRQDDFVPASVAAEQRGLIKELSALKANNRTFHVEKSAYQLDAGATPGQKTIGDKSMSINDITKLTGDLTQSEVLMSFAKDFAIESRKSQAAKDKLSFYKEARQKLDDQAAKIITQAYKNGKEVAEKLLSGTTLKDGKVRERKAGDKLADLEKMVKDPASFGKVADEKALAMLTSQKIVADYQYNVRNQHKYNEDLRASLTELGKLSDRNFSVARKFGKDAEFNEFAVAKTPEEKLASRLVTNYLDTQKQLEVALNKATPAVKEQASKIKLEGVEGTINAGDKIRPHAIVNELSKAVAKTQTVAVEKSKGKKMGM